MTTVPPEAPAPAGPEPDPGPRVSSAQLRDVSRLRRTVRAERKIAGVAGGLARHLDIDPLVVRVAFVVLALFGGSGVLLYGALWLLLPEDGAESAAIRLDERSRSVALVGVGLIAGLVLLGTWSDARWVSWPLAVVALIVLVVATARDRRPPSYPAGAYPAGAYPPGPYPPYAAAPPPPQEGAPLGGPPPAAPLPAGPTWAAPPPPPRNPRRRGPLLVWFTLALMTLGMGVLGLVDVGGADIPVSAYPAVATALAGTMLLVGAFYGRAGGIIFLGLVSATAMAGTAIGERVETRADVVRPTTAVALGEDYSVGAGEYTYDLTGIVDLSSLDGRRIRIEQGMGMLEVILPRGIDVQVTTSLGAGEASVLGAERGGLGLEFTETRDVANEPATLYLDLDMGFGEVDVHLAPEPGTDSAEVTR